MRGAAELLVGKPNRKQDKPLHIPTLAERKPRAPIFGSNASNMLFKANNNIRGEDSKSKLSSSGGGGSLDDEELDESLFEQYFQNNPPPDGNGNAGDDNNDDDDEEDSYDENGALKPKKPKVITDSNDPNYKPPPRERRQSHIAKAKQFQAFLQDAEQRKAMKKQLFNDKEREQQDELASTNNLPKTRGKQTMLVLATHGARKSVMANRGVPMMSMNMISALNQPNHASALHQQTSVLTAGTSTTSASSTMDDDPQPTHPSVPAAGVRRNNQRAMSRLQLAPPGLAALRKSSVTNGDNTTAANAAVEGDSTRRLSQLSRRTSSSAAV